MIQKQPSIGPGTSESCEANLCEATWGIILIVSNAVPNMELMIRQVKSRSNAAVDARKSVTAVRSVRPRIGTCTRPLARQLHRLTTEEELNR